jgi:hypothetical protein
MTPLADGATRYVVDVPEWVHKVLVILPYKWDAVLGAMRKGADNEAAFGDLIKQFAEDEQYYTFWLAGVPVTFYNHGDVITLSKVGNQYVMKMKNKDIRVVVPVTKPALWWVSNIRTHPYKKLGHLMWIAQIEGKSIKVDKTVMFPGADVIHNVLQAVLNKVPFTVATAMTGTLCPIPTAQ